MLFDGRAGGAGHVVPVRMLVTKAAADKVIQQSVMPQLQLGPQTNIAGQQAQQNVVPLAQRCQ